MCKHEICSQAHQNQHHHLYSPTTKTEKHSHIFCTLRQPRKEGSSTNIKGLANVTALHFGLWNCKCIMWVGQHYIHLRDVQRYHTRWDTNAKPHQDPPYNHCLKTSSICTVPHTDFTTDRSVGKYCGSVQSLILLHFKTISCTKKHGMTMLLKLHGCTQDIMNFFMVRSSGMKT